MVYKDKEKQKEYRRQYYLNNKDKWSKKCEHQKQKSRCVECKGSEICEHQKQKNRCGKCNIFGYLVNLQRSRLYTILHNNNISKTKPTIEYLDCSSEFFVEWIKNKFVDGMTFDNIHLDHISFFHRFPTDITKLHCIYIL